MIAPRQDRDVHRIGARWLRRSPQRATESAKTIAWSGQSILEVSDDLVAGDGANFILPTIANGHDHCRGIANISFGATDQPLELWLPGMYAAPVADPYLVAAVAYGRMVRSGIGSTAHFYVPQAFPRIVEEAKACARAARDVGIRLDFCVPMRDRYRLAYGPDQGVLPHLAPPDREEINRRFNQPARSPSMQVRLVEEIASEIENDLISVSYSPTGIQWCSTELIELIAEASEATGRGVQMHLLETKRQREFVDSAYPEGVIRYLDRVGLLSERLTLAHGVFLRPDEIELLAERKVRVVVNTSSNLRLRSGIAPVDRFLSAGLDFALGVDNMALDDDDDGFRELRLAHLVHGGRNSRGNGLTWQRAMMAAWVTGQQIITRRHDVGALEPGHAADFVALDYARLAADSVIDNVDPLELVLGRACAHFVMKVVVAGRVLVDNGRVLGINLDETKDELSAQARASIPGIIGIRPLLDRYRAALARFYDSDGHRITSREET